MDNEQPRALLPWERLVLCLSGVVGLLLLFLSTSYETHKFLAKLAEVIGTALILVVIVDVWFAQIRFKATRKDREQITEAENVLADVRKYLDGAKHQATEDRLRDIQRTVKRLSETMESNAQSSGNKPNAL